MPADHEHLRAYPIPEVEQRVCPDDCILYALGVGLGADPVDRGQLRYVYEEGLEALPMMANVLAYPGFWLKNPDTGVDWKRVLHGEQAFTIHRPLPVAATLVGRTRIVGVNDKGSERGAVVWLERRVTDAATGEPVCTLEQTSVLRGDGGCGGADPAPHEPHVLPQRAPDLHCDLPVAPNSALLYRLNGDRNPLHADPAVAAAAGFPRPILHGMCTMAHAGHAILRTLCDYEPARLHAMRLRFTAPVFPGETLRTEMWVDGAVVGFRSRVLERDLLVLGNGRAEIAEAA